MALIINCLRKIPFPAISVRLRALSIGYEKAGRWIVVALLKFRGNPYLPLSALPKHEARSSGPVSAKSPAMVCGSGFVCGNLFSFPFERFVGYGGFFGFGGGAELSIGTFYHDFCPSHAGGEERIW